MDSLTAIIIGFSVLFLASATQGLAGFGFAIVAVPILIIFLSPKIAIPIIIIHAVVINIFVIIGAYRWVNIKRILPLVIASLAGIPIGTWLLIVLDVSAMKILIGSVIVPFVIAYWLGFRRQVKNERLAFAPVGFASGLMGASMSIGGPPVILFFVNQDIEKRFFRENLVTYYLIAGLAILVSYIVGGVINETVIRYAVWFLPATIIGSLTGIKLAPRVNEKLFRKIALTVVMIAALSSIASGLGLLRAG